MGEGPRRGDRHQPPAGRRRDRAPPLRRPRACCTTTAPAAPTSSPATRPLDADDEHRARPHARRPARPGLLRLLRPPLRVAAHAAAASIAEIVRERCYAAAAGARATSSRGSTAAASYALVRAWATVIQLDLQVAAVIGDLLAGRPVVYTTFLAYDEVAHHSGIERPDTLAVLRKLDRQIGRIARAAAEAPRPYRLVVLSDHGQSQGATFLQRYGESLEELVDAACEPAVDARARRTPTTTSADFLGAELTEARDATTRRRPHGARADARRRSVDGEVTLDEDRREADEARAGEDEPPELSVMASGCLGLDHLPARAGPGDARADRGALPGADRTALRAPPRDRLRARALRARRRASRSAPTAPTGSTRAWSRARTRSRRSAPTPPTTCGAPTLPALPRHRPQQHLLGGDRRGRRLRGARRLARRHGRRAVATRSLSRPVEPPAARTSRSSAPSTCTGSSAAGSRSSGTPATPTTDGAARADRAADRSPQRPAAALESLPVTRRNRQCSSAISPIASEVGG